MEGSVGAQRVLGCEWPLLEVGNVVPWLVVHVTGVGPKQGFFSGGYEPLGGSLDGHRRVAGPPRLLTKGWAFVHMCVFPTEKRVLGSPCILREINCPRV